MGPRRLSCPLASRRSLHALVAHGPCLTASYPFAGRAVHATAASAPLSPPAPARRSPPAPPLVSHARQPLRAPPPRLPHPSVPERHMSPATLLRLRQHRVGQREMQRRGSCFSGVSCSGQRQQLVFIVWVLVLLVFSWRMGAAQAQQAPKTDPLEAASLNTILGRWGRRVSPEWNISGELCSGKASDKSNWDDYPDINPFIKCDCSFINNTVCHIIKLRVFKLNVVGQIPSELQNLPYLDDVNLAHNYLTGSLPSFIGKFTSMKYLSLAFNPLSGPLPKELGNLNNLLSLSVSFTKFAGELPEELGNLTKLQQLYIDSCGFTGPFPSTFSMLKNLNILRASDNDFTGKIPDYFGGLTNLKDLAFQGNSFEGPIPTSFSNLTKLTNLRIGDIVNGSSSLAFISNLTSLSNLILRNCRISGTLGPVDFSKFRALMLLDLSFNNITGQIPQSILNQEKLVFLFLGNNSLTGRLPDVISSSLKTIDFSYNQLTGSLPSWATQNNLQLNLVANNLVIGSATIGQTRWGVSNVGKFIEASNGMDIVYSPQQFQNVVDSKLFESARMSSSSLRYYGLGLENGNYTVLLQFAEFAYPDTQTWQSLGRRVFDIYIQGALKEKNFDIRMLAGGKSFVTVHRSYTAAVVKNMLEIHLFWAGKGTSGVPQPGYYGPMISALSVTPNFTPTVRNGVPKRRSKAGAIAGISIGASVLGLTALIGMCMLVNKRRAMAKQREELYNLIGRSDVFSSAELKLATDNFSSQNVLGEGGYGPVYKGKLPDGRVIAVKQLSHSSHQGKKRVCDRGYYNFCRATPESCEIAWVLH
ncbi:hypothetical protein GUJ93_ZPchr0010g7619 [Zizania palustris]|uniref:non-specific serine/threonine protein kinase n=1 Tax=Zizania palustris TaxID=103762 RepID=A0A8J5W9P9_ZIZPA|nr:hypothetical protein GUJ93_ZPchr0010g7619 [Zizania palustris]